MNQGRCQVIDPYGWDGHSLVFICTLDPGHDGPHTDEWWHHAWDTTTITFTARARASTRTTAGSLTA